ncbi:MAG: hypothetical protein D6785_16545, partial [Planctomycetota bacterium]
INSNETLVFWNIFSRIPSTSSLNSEVIEESLSCLRKKKSVFQRVQILFTFLQGVQGNQKNLIFQTILEELQNLHGEKKILGEFLRGLWLEKEGKSFPKDSIMSKLDSLPVMTDKLRFVEEIFFLSLHSQIFSHMGKKLLELFLEDALHWPNLKFPKTLCSLATKAVIAKGWSYAKPIFETAFQLIQKEETENKNENMKTLIFDLIETAESVGITEAWLKALVFTSKVKAGEYQHACLSRLFELPVYAISTDGAKIAKIFREIGRISSEEERHRIFIKGCKWLHQKSYLIANKSTLWNILRRIYRSFRKAFLAAEALGWMALVSLSWNRYREAGDFFSLALERCFSSPNQYQCFRCLQILAPCLAKACDLEDKGEFIHDILDYGENQLNQYQPEMYVLLFYILESWDRRERAENALRKAVELIPDVEGEWKKGSAILFFLKCLKEKGNSYFVPYIQKIFEEVSSMHSPVLKNKIFTMISILYLYWGQRKESFRFYEKALEEVKKNTLLIHQAHLLEEMLISLQEEGAYENEKLFFEKTEEEIQTIT